MQLYYLEFPNSDLCNLYLDVTSEGSETRAFRQQNISLLPLRITESKGSLPRHSVVLLQVSNLKIYSVVKSGFLREARLNAR